MGEAYHGSARVSDSRTKINQEKSLNEKRRAMRVIEKRNESVLASSANLGHAYRIFGQPGVWISIGGQAETNDPCFQRLGSDQQRALIGNDSVDPVDGAFVEDYAEGGE